MTFIVTYLTNGSDASNESFPSTSTQGNSSDTAMKYKNDTAYKTFAFLYGAIPTAPTALVYASKYNYGEEMVCFFVLF